MKVKSEREVAQSCPTLRDPVDCSLPGSSVHGIFQARVLDWEDPLEKEMATFTLVFGEGDGTPLQYSCLENPMDGGGW